MSFKKPLPTWKAQGIQPPEHKLEEGWKAQDKPPAGWLNWQANTTYEALQELQDNAVDHRDVTSEPSANGVVRLNVAGKLNEAVLAGAEHKEISLKPGVQIVESDQVTPFNVGSIKGRTFVNKLGRQGLFQRKWGAYACAHELLGNGVAKYTGDGTAVNPQVWVRKKGTKPSVGDVLFLRAMARFINTDHPSSLNLYLYHSNVGLSSFDKIENPTNNIWYDMGVSFVVNQAFVDNWDSATFVIASGFPTPEAANSITTEVQQAAMYIIPSADQNLAKAELLAKYPYEDSMTNVTNPYAIATGDNLLPPFYEWVRGSGAAFGVFNVETPYTADMSKSEFGYNSIGINAPATSKTDYVFSFNVDVANIAGTVGAGCYWNMVAYDSQANLIEDFTTPPFATTNGTHTLSKRFRTPHNTAYIKVVIGVDSGTTGSFKVTNPMLTVGSEPKPFKPQSRSLWAAECELAADPLDGTNADMLFMGDDGLPYVLEMWEKAEVNNPQWTYYNVTTAGLMGAKIVAVNGDFLGGATPNQDNVYLRKFDDSLVKHNKTSTVTWTDESMIISKNSNQVTSLYLWVPNTDSGWGDAYTPTADEIKAYFLGWKMGRADDPAFPSWNNDGTKMWYKLYCGVGTKHPTAVGAPIVDGSAVFIVPTVLNDQGYTPYRLQYLKSTPAVEPVRNYETGLMLCEGSNVVGVGSGIVIREKANPTYYSPNGNYYINNTAVSGSLLKNKVSHILRAYRNGRFDNTAKIENDANAYGKQHVRFLQSEFDPTAVYYVTYTMLEPTLSVPISGTVSTNLRGTVSDLVQRSGDIERCMSVVENQKVDKESPPWITPTLLNGWVRWGDRWAPPQYYKDDSGIVHLRGLIKGGVIDGGKQMFVLPQGYRPSHSSCYVTYSQGGSVVEINGVVARIDVSGETGSVYPTRGSNELFSLEGISFRAEN